MATGGSRYLKEPFAAHEERLQATDRIMELQFAHLERRLEKIEGLIERLEKRLWLSVYGVVAVIVTQAVLGILDTAPT